MIHEAIEGFRLSPQQRRLWSLHQVAHGMPYWCQCAVRLAGAIDVSLLVQSLQEVVERHEIMRTSFQQLPGMTLPVQVIAPEQQVALRKHNLSGLQAASQSARIAELLQQQLQLPNDDAFVCRFDLIKLAAAEHILLISMPSLYQDAAGMVQFVRETACEYARLSGAEEDVAEPMQYVDIAEWQNELFEQEDAESGKVFWRERLLMAPLDPRLPIEAPAAAPGALASVSGTIAAPQVAQINALVQAADCSLAAFLMTCWQIALWRRSGQANLVIGMFHDGRSYDEVQTALGLLAKYVPVGGQLAKDLPFSTLLADTAAAMNEAAEWQDYFSWEVLAEQVPKQALLPSYAFGFDFVPSLEIFTAGDLLFAIEQLQSSIERFKLRLVCRQDHDAIALELHYDSERFTQTLARHMLDSLQTLVDSALANPAAAIGTLDVLGAAEQSQLLAFSGAIGALPAQSCLHEVFAAQVERTPHAVALDFAGQQLSYRELDSRANQLAHYLRAQGVGPDVLVAICMERSLDLMVGLLAIFKAGGAYLPLDANDPAERLAFMLNDVQVPVLLTQQQVLERLPGLPAMLCTTTLFALDREQSVIDSYPTTAPESGVAGNNLAYVLYTSGSTGRPKGVMIEHLSLVNYLAWVNDQVFGTQVQHVPVLSRLTFDASLKQLFAPLMRGGSVWMLPDTIITQPAALLAMINERTNVGLNCVPALWEAMLAVMRSGDVPAPTGRLTTLMLGGERLRPELVEQTLQLLPDLQIWNLYGPTEATANVSAAQITRADQITIGRPLTNMQAYVLDDYLHPVPIGTPGELYVGGIGLARGYLNCPDLTAARFIPSPVASSEAARLYRSGDLARYLPDGTIEFLGRTDHQVKLRGLRIELGEIEAVLEQHAQVQQAVVTVREDTPGDQRLVAYVVLARTQGVNQTDLRSFLQVQLPDYMVPSLFVMLDALPRMPNGKIDRHALPAPEIVIEQDQVLAPRTPIEEVLVGIWAEILKRPEVGVNQDFFALGGHSLLATQLFARVRKVFAIDLPMRSMLEATTVEELAKLLIAHESAPGQLEKVAQTFLRIKHMSPDERQRFLEQKRSERSVKS